MIPGSFDYHCPTSVADAIALLVKLGEDARPLAGGHSLIPMMKTRLATPEHLVDLRAIGDLKAMNIPAPPARRPPARNSLTLERAATSPCVSVVR